ncbi:MAG: hypothetical protein M3O70_27450 [Actinomycetota bacterium]|nr:hypothetical protein [Actinomycetota bacterium]
MPNPTPTEAEIAALGQALEELSEMIVELRQLANDGFYADGALLDRVASEHAALRNAFEGMRLPEALEHAKTARALVKEISVDLLRQYREQVATGGQDS